LQKSEGKANNSHKSDKSSTSDSDEVDEDLLKEASVTSDWILNKTGVYEDEKQKQMSIVHCTGHDSSVMHTEVKRNDRS